MNVSHLRQYDLIPKISEYLDIHLLLPILHFIEENKVYPHKEILQGKIDLLSKTNLVDYKGDTYKELHETDSIPEEMEKEKTAIINKLTDVETKSKKFSALIEDEEALAKLIENDHFNLPYLEENHQIHQEDVDALYTLAKFQYECGKYNEAASYLHYWIMLNTDPQKNLMAMWGKLASDILMSYWKDAEHGIAAIRDQIEDSKLALSPQDQLQQRVWLLHWSLCVFFHLPNGAVTMLDFFLGNERYLRAIEIKAPWILRYLAISAILTKYRLKELVKIVEQESDNYSDPITEFIRALYVRYDFDSAEKILEVCAEVLKYDYFISSEDLKEKNFREEFLTAARLAVCEAFVKIHSTINIETIAKKLGKSNEDTERWVLNIIRNSKADVKVDNNVVTVLTQVPSVYQQLLEKTKSLTLRAGVAERTRDQTPTQKSKEDSVGSDQ